MMTERLGNMSSNFQYRGYKRRRITKVQVLNEKANQTKDASLKIVDQIKSLNSDMVQIRKITKLMVGIAEQTNLLSLNAAIEAPCWRSRPDLLLLLMRLKTCRPV